MAKQETFIRNHLFIGFVNKNITRFKTFELKVYQFLRERHIVLLIERNGNASFDECRNSTRIPEFPNWSQYSRRLPSPFYDPRGNMYWLWNIASYKTVRVELTSLYVPTGLLFTFNISLFIYLLSYFLVTLYFISGSFISSWL